MKRFALFAVLALVGATSGFLTVRLHQQNAGWRSELARRRAGQPMPVRAEPDAAVRPPVALSDAGEPPVDRALAGRVMTARAKVADMERSALATYEENQAEREARERALQDNRDLTRGPVLVENCTNVGRATPVDSLQSTVWAALAGDDAVLLEGIALTSVARERLQAVLEQQSAAVRTLYTTPERLAALYISDVVSSSATLEVLEQTPIDAEHAVLKLRLLNGRKLEVPFVRSTYGWQLQFSDQKIARELTSRLLGRKR